MNATQRSSLSRNALEGENLALEAENAALRKEVEHLHGELSRPKHETLRQLAEAVQRAERAEQRVKGLEVALEHEHERWTGHLAAERERTKRLEKALRLALSESSLLFHPGEDGCRLCDVRNQIEAALREERRDAE